MDGVDHSMPMTRRNNNTLLVCCFDFSCDLCGWTSHRGFVISYMEGVPLHCLRDWYLEIYVLARRGIILYCIKNWVCDTVRYSASDTHNRVASSSWALDDSQGFPQDHSIQSTSKVTEKVFFRARDCWYKNLYIHLVGVDGRRPDHGYHAFLNALQLYNTMYSIQWKSRALLSYQWKVSSPNKKTHWHVNTILIYYLIVKILHAW